MIEIPEMYKRHTRDDIESQAEHLKTIHKAELQSIVKNVPNIFFLHFQAERELVLRGGAKDSLHDGLECVDYEHYNLSKRIKRSRK